MLTIFFEGWFQCRFATDPDPSDEPRGVSGPTFVVPGEPYFDRIIRLNDPVAPRFPREHDVGVTVRKVMVGDQIVAAHALLGARVDLLDSPRYEQRNLIIASQAFYAPIDPFHLQISAPGITLRRKDLWDVTQPDLTIYDVARNYPSLLPRRLNGIAIRSPEVAEATGVLNYEQYRRQRKQQLIELRECATDPTARLAFEKRIRALAKDETMTGIALAGTQFLGLCATYAFALNGPAAVIDERNALGGEVGASQDWPLSFWMGGYDVDTLCGYMRGTLSVPFRLDG